ncbi:MAG TPA: hypothetical protein VN775_01325 [Opitutaceae bacterium]|nr:hypothetical protein [Opitutaceae bacterium]
MSCAARPRPLALVRAVGAAGLCLVALACAARGQDDLFDRVDDQLTFAAWGDAMRARLSGTLDLEGYYLRQPAPGLIFSEGNEIFNPRLTLYLDAQLGPRVYAFVESRADNGFDPGEPGPTVRLDEYVLRLTPWDDGRFSLQVGKFATVVGNWSLRHGSWDNPFITAPLPYENLTGIWDTTAARAAGEVLAWAGLQPRPAYGGVFLDEYRDIPIIWGPSYTSGAAVFGDLGKLDYAFELKNTSLSSRPETWAPTETGWQHPTVSGRLGFRPGEMWNLGFSASAGTYLQPMAEPTLAPGRGLGQYLEVVLGQDAAFAWHHVQVWAEIYEARFEIPEVGNAETQAYYVEVKYKFTPQFFGALRWNQQLFSRFPDASPGAARWGRNVERVDIGPGYRFTPHMQVKLQYSLEHQDADSQNWGDMLAVQFTARF